MVQLAFEPSWTRITSTPVSKFDYVLEKFNHLPCQNWRFLHFSSTCKTSVPCTNICKFIILRAKPSQISFHCHSTCNMRRREPIYWCRHNPPSPKFWQDCSRSDYPSLEIIRCVSSNPRWNFPRKVQNKGAETRLVCRTASQAGSWNSGPTQHFGRRVIPGVSGSVFVLSSLQILKGFPADIVLSWFYWSHGRWGSMQSPFKLRLMTTILRWVDVNLINPIHSVL